MGIFALTPLTLAALRPASTLSPMTIKRARLGPLLSDCWHARTRHWRLCGWVKTA